MSEQVVVVVAGGPPPHPAAADEIPEGATVIAADDGLEHALSLGLRVALAVGDFDSVSPDALERASTAGTRIERHREDKDATDLELALDAALRLRATRVFLLAGEGGRLDHALSTLLVLGLPRYSAFELDGIVGRARIHVIRDGRALHGRAGELVSLFALGGRVEGVSTEGLAYALEGETLEPGSSRGVSNVFESDLARVTVSRGTILAIRPGSGVSGRR